MLDSAIETGHAGIRNSRHAKSARGFLYPAARNLGIDVEYRVSRFKETVEADTRRGGPARFSDHVVEAAPLVLSVIFVGCRRYRSGLQGVRMAGRAGDGQ